MEEQKQTEKPKQARKTTSKSTSKSTTEKATTKTTSKSTKKDEEIAELKELLAQQQAMIEQLMNSKSAPKEATLEEVPNTTRINKGTVINRGLTKQGLRRKYRNIDIYVQSAIVGTVCYNGKDDVYEWYEKGEVVPMTIDDIIGMPEPYLHNPWLVLDDYENNEEVLDDIISCLGLEDNYRKLYILTELDENINSINMQEFAQLVEESKQEGGTLAFDATAIVQSKIDKGVLDSNAKIEKFEQILGRSFNK